MGFRAVFLLDMEKYASKNGQCNLCLEWQNMFGVGYEQLLSGCNLFYMNYDCLLDLLPPLVRIHGYLDSV